MTRDEINALAGHALAEAVAEHVMRWQRVVAGDAVNRCGSVWADEKNAWRIIPVAMIRESAGTLFGIVAEVWEPHKDMRHAWQVFMEAPGQVKRLHFEDGKYHAMIGPSSWGPDGDMGGCDEYIHGRPELALCRAALLAAMSP